MTYEGDLLPLRAALIKTALRDALQEQQPSLAQESRTWLERNGYAHLLDHPGASQFAPEARQRKTHKRASAPQSMENHI